MASLESIWILKNDSKLLQVKLIVESSSLVVVPDMATLVEETTKKNKTKQQQQKSLTPIIQLFSSQGIFLCISKKQEN